MGKCLILHIGLPKTATTTLQEALFYPLYQKGIIDYLGVASLSDEARHKNRYEMPKHIVNNGQFIETKIEVKECNTTIYSEELLTASYENLDRYLDSGIGSIITPSQINHFFNREYKEIKILLILRAQATFLHSYYVETMFRDPYKKIDGSFREYAQHVKENMEYYWVFQYDLLIKKYCEVFGEDKVKVLLFEDFINSKNKFIPELAQFLNVDEELVDNLLENKHFNKRMIKNESIRIEVLANKKIFGLVSLLKANKRNGERFSKCLEKLKKTCIYYIYKRLFYKETIIPLISIEESKLIQDYYLESNLRLMKDLGLDENKMKTYGYI